MAALILSLVPALLAQETPRAVTRASAVDDPTRSGDRWALIIGVDNYQDEALDDLAFPAVDAANIAETLISSGAWPSSHVILMTPDQADPRLWPTRSNILTQLDALKVQPGFESLFFYYSGHGAATGGEERSNYVFPQDLNVNRLEDTGFRLDDLLVDLDQIKAQRRFLVLDACRNQLYADARALPPAWSETRYGVSEGTRILYSTKFGSYAFERDDLGMGVLTYNLVRGLQGLADGTEGNPVDGIVSANEIYAWVTQQMAEQAGSGRIQEPAQGGEWSGEDFPLTPVTGWEASARCPASARALRRALDSAAAPDLSAGAYLRAVRMVTTTFACLSAPVSPELAARYHHFSGDAALYVRDTEAALLSYRALHELDPGLNLSFDDPTGALLWSQATALTPSPRGAIYVPEDERLIVDGTEDQSIPLDRPAIVQLVRAKGKDVLSTGMHQPQDPLPALPPPPPRSPRDTAGRRLGKVAIGTGLTTVGLAGLKAINQNNYEHGKQNVLASNYIDPELSARQERYLANSISYGKAMYVSGAVTVGLATTSIVLRF